MRQVNQIARMIPAAYRLQLACLNRKLAPLGLGGGSYTYLLTIVENPGIAQCDLVERMTLDRTTASKMLRYLEKKGLIARQANPDDARGVILHPTPQGAGLYQAAGQAVSEYRRQMLEGISAEAERAFLQILSQITANIKSAMEQEKMR